MKNIKNIIIASIVLLFTFTSCESDENIFEYVGTDATKITGTLTTVQTIVNQGASIAFDYTLPQSFSKDAILQIDGLYGDANVVTTTITILSGETSGSGTIDLTGDDVGFGGQIFKVTMGGIRLVEFQDVEDEDGNLVNLPIPTEGNNFELTSNTIEVLVHQDFEEGKANISLGWDDGSDLDIRLRDASGNVVGSAETGANPESFTLDDTLADGDYTLGVIYYGIVDDALNYTFKVRTSDGQTQIVTGSLSGYVESTSAEINVFKFTKSGVNYTITEL